jgi:hypothetical protein
VLSLELSVGMIADVEWLWIKLEVTEEIFDSNVLSSRTQRHSQFHSLRQHASNRPHFDWLHPSHRKYSVPLKCNIQNV